MEEIEFNDWEKLFIYCTKLTVSQRVVLGFIIDAYINNNFYATSMSFISDSTGISLSTVKRTLKDLEDMKLIKRYISLYKNSIKATNGYKPNMELIECIIK